MHKKNDPVSEFEWIQSEAIRMLMQTRLSSNILISLGIVLIAVQLYGHISTGRIVTWMFSAFVLLVIIYFYKKSYAKRLNAASIAEKVAFIEGSRQIWSVNALIWGLSGWLFFARLPLQNQFVCAFVLSLMGFLGVLKLTPYRIVAQQYINVLFGTQIVGVVWHIGIENGLQSPPLQYYYLCSLIVSWAMFRMLERRFYSTFHRNLVFQFRNNALVTTLNLQAEQLQREKQLALDANETIRRFYASAAHDIRQPVYALGVYSGLVQENPSQALELAPKMIKSCHAINALFQSLFDFEKIQLGQVVVVHEQVDISELFDELETHFLPMAKDKNLEMRMMPLKGSLLTDAALIRSVLNHLITNAIRYTHQGGLLVAARKYAEHISLEVWDTGIGIDRDHHDQVFDEFFKVHEQSSSDAGFGLGLSVVKQLAELVEGSSVSMVSRLGQGSVFRFKVPLALHSMHNA